ncbi:MAG: VanZ family protein [Lachnospiraceae bacterium]|nr:VanZ family protein [Lachnospiraceae bacterium]
MKLSITKQSIIKIFSFIPALLIMSMIFSFSAQDSSESSSLSEKISIKVIEITDELLTLDLSDAQAQQATERIHTFIRKLGHFSEYLALGVSLVIPLYVVYHVRGRRLFLVPLCFCILFASTDEIHQLFVDGRHGSPKDVLIDSCGALTGILFSQMLCYILRKCIYEPLHLHNKNASKCNQ